MLQAALFELENVLVESRAARAAALAEAFAAEGVALPAVALAPHVDAPTLEEAVTTAADSLAPHLDATARELVARRAERGFARALAAGVSLAPGARGTLDALAGTLRLGLVTRARRPEVEGVLALAGLEAHFACVVTADDVRVPKPAPDGYRAALARLAARGGVDPGRTVAFEAAAPGVAAARGAGLRVVWVASSAQRDPDAAAPGGAAADARLASIAGLTPGSLAALLDLPVRP